MGTCKVLNRQTAQVHCTRIAKVLDHTNTDNSTNYYDTPMYVVNVLGGAVSRTYICLPESKTYICAA